LETARAAHDSRGQARLLEQLGTTAGLIGEPGEATGYLAEALRLTRQIGDQQTEERVISKLAENAKAAKNLPATIAAYRELLARAKASGDKQAQALDSGILGKVLREAGQPEAAIPLLRDAASLFGAGGQRREAGISFFHLGKALASRERYLEAADAYKRAAAIGGEVGEASFETDALHSLGNTKYYLGDYAGAADTLEQALRLARRSGEREAEALILMSLGNVRHFQDDQKKAIEYWEQTLSIARALADKGLQGKTLGNLALAHTHLREFDKAKAYYWEDIAIARERGDRHVEAQALGNLATLQMSIDAWTDAIPLLEQSAKLASEVGYRRGEAIALGNLGRSQLHNGQAGAAVDTLRGAVARFEELRENSKGEDASSISLLDAQQGAYRALQAALVADNKPEAALEASERGRGRALADLLAGRAAPAVTPAPLPIEKIRAVAHSLRATLVEYSIIENPDDTGGGAIYIWVVHPNGRVIFRRTGITSHGTSLEANLGGIAGDLRATLGALGLGKVPPTRPGIAGRDEMLALFYKLVVAPIADVLPSTADEPVVIIPQGPLFLLPFAALRDPDGKPLVQSYSLLMAPSIQTLALVKRQAVDDAGDSAVVVGNPAFSAIKLDRGSDAVLLPQLPGAEAESTAVGALLGAKPLTGRDATKLAVLQEIAAARYVHLATHGILDYVGGQGLPGALALAASASDDGLLTTPEIMQLRLRANLVVLSACNTGAGKISSDGVIGLARAFLVAGARSVVVSLWNAPDQPTRDLMVAFYRKLPHAPGKAQALRLAMLETSKLHPNPLDWAGFILLGENE
jgi:tetratricopeptide (TPR) repeat protein